jgi:asparagine synthase (glutamine-hydrolysing)
MSAQFGKWNFDGAPPAREYLAKAEIMLAPYGPDGGNSYSADGAGIVYRAFHTTKESRDVEQPYISTRGAVITWDGRLDNRGDLILALGGALSNHSPDVTIVAAAFDRWGTDGFSTLIGDWALSIWDPSQRSLILARDPFGARRLYYFLEDEQVTWSTLLDPIVLLCGKAFSLCEEYVAGWISFFPAAHLTPYVGIHSVPPSFYVSIRNRRPTAYRYWDFDPGKGIRYNSDAEYEEHFRSVFADAVGCRLRSDTPVLAELSGGMDSSSIVLMADTILHRGSADAPRLDTLSYYNDSEPNWDERPYFTKVEERRGCSGCHIDVGRLEPLTTQFESTSFAATPGSSCSRLSESGMRFSECLASQGNRVLLSGIGGDEVTGGVPTAAPELADLLARAEFRRLARQLRVWALNKRKPWLQLLFEAARGFFPTALVGRDPAPWLCSAFLKENRTALRGYETRLKLFGPLPSFQENTSTLALLRRQLSCEGRPPEPAYEKRFPYVDRQLLEFLFAIPREQLVRPGQRRSLMRRALAGIVPEEILNRKRKPFVVRAPLVKLSTDWRDLLETNQQMVSSSLNIVDAKVFRQTLQTALDGQQVGIVPLMRTLGIELWLRAVKPYGVLAEG